MPLNFCRICITSVVLAVSLQASAAGADVAIGEDQIIKGNLIEVLDPGTDLVAIVDGITDASEDNPYLVKIGPGAYQLVTQLVVPPHVHLLGAGPGATVLNSKVGGTFTDNSAAVVSSGSANISIRSLSIVVNNGGADLTAVGLGSIGDDQIEHVAVSVTGATSTNIGIHFETSTTPRVSHVQAHAFGDGVSNQGFFARTAGTFSAIEAIASGDGSNNSGFLDLASTAVIRASTLRAEGDGSSNNGYARLGSDFVGRLENVDALAEGAGSTNCGVNVTALATAVAEDSRLSGIDATGVGVSAGACSAERLRIRRSTVEGSTASLDPSGGDAEFRITQSTLIPGSAGTTNGSADYVCLYSDLFTPGAMYSDPDTTVVLDTDCDNSN